MTTTQVTTVGKFIVSSTSLLSALKRVATVIKPTTIIPIASYVKIDIKGDNMKLTATNLAIYAKYDLDVYSKVDCSFCLPALDIIRLLQLLPEQPLTVEFDSEIQRVLIKSDEAEFSFETENALDFPVEPKSEFKQLLNIDCLSLTEAIDSTIEFASYDELRPAMTGVFFKFSDTSITLVSTDGHRLSVLRRVDHVGDFGTSFIINRGQLSLIKSLLIKGEVVSISFDPDTLKVQFISGNMVISCRTMDESFPDYDKAIPTDNQNVLVFYKKDFCKRIEIAKIFSNCYTNQCVLQLEKDNVKVMSENMDENSKSTQKLSIDYEGEETKIGFNSKLLLSMFRKVKHDNLKMEIGKPNKAVLIRPYENRPYEDLTLLLMPVMLNSYN